MNDEQYKRYRKLQSENIKCLFKTQKNDTLYFLISGSSGTRYKVCIPNDGKITCSCPDFKHNSKNNECVCKHCLHVILNVLRVFNIDHTFFKRCFFTRDELDEIYSILKHKKK